jgi:multimeric flavodoxin WrbA
MTKILAINGSYRNNGITDQIIDVMEVALQAAGAEVEIILLRNYPVGFCLNCRECTQQPGNVPGECIQHDGMQELINKIENSDGFILASPTNFGSVSAVFKRFMERLVVYAYWPWNMNTPQYRKANEPKKKAVLISSCAAPGIVGRWFFSTHKQLKTTAHTIGARTVGSVFIGLIAREQHHGLSERQQSKARALAKRLI